VPHSCVHAPAPPRPRWPPRGVGAGPVPPFPRESTPPPVPPEGPRSDGMELCIDPGMEPKARPGEAGRAKAGSPPWADWSMPLASGIGGAVVTVTMLGNGIPAARRAWVQGLPAAPPPAAAATATAAPPRRAIPPPLALPRPRREVAFGAAATGCAGDGHAGGSSPPPPPKRPSPRSRSPPGGPVGGREGLGESTRPPVAFRGAAGASSSLASRARSVAPGGRRPWDPGPCEAPAPGPWAAPSVPPEPPEAERVTRPRAEVRPAVGVG